MPTPSSSASSSPSSSTSSSPPSSPTTSPSSGRRTRSRSINSSNLSSTTVLQIHQDIDDRRRRSSEGSLGSTPHIQLEVLSTSIRSMNASILLNTLMIINAGSELGSIGCLSIVQGRNQFFTKFSFIMIFAFMLGTILLSVNTFFLIHERRRIRGTNYFNLSSVVWAITILLLFLYPIIVMTQEDMHCTSFLWITYFSFVLLMIFCTIVFGISFFSHRHMTRTLIAVATTLLMGVNPLREVSVLGERRSLEREETAVEVSTQENTEEEEHPGACGFDSDWKPENKDD